MQMKQQVAASGVTGGLLRKWRLRMPSETESGFIGKESDHVKKTSFVNCVAFRPSAAVKTQPLTVVRGSE